MARKKRMLLIINPKSGKGRLRPKLLDVLDLFIREGYEVQAYVTQGPKDAREAVVKYGAKKDRIVCCGGDGTLNETLWGLMELPKSVPLGYIPVGSTNDFAASLRIPKQILTAAKTAAEGEPRPVDIGYFCGERYFAYVAGFGAFTEVSYLTPQDKKNVLGHQAYMLEGVRSLASIKSYPMSVSWEGGQAEGEFIFGMVTNTISVGGFKGLVNQEVALDDGLFEVLLIRRPKTPVEFSNIVTSLFLRDEREQELVYKFKTPSIRFQAQEPVDWVLDGEFGGAKTEVFVENLYRRLKIC